MKNQAPLHIAALVSESLNQSTLSGLSEILKSISNAVNAYGCILWQVAPTVALDANPPMGELFVLAEWFPDDQGSTLYDLPLHHSETGVAVISQKTINVPDIWNDERIFLGDSFLHKAEIKAMCSIPISFRDGIKGTVNLYRNAPQPFSQDELELAEQLASLVPALYQTVRNEVGLRLIGSINKLAHEAEASAIEPGLDENGNKELIQKICDFINDTFQCVETSIFLEDYLEQPGLYKLMATTWPQVFDKTTYEKSDAGLTGWILSHARPVRIFDLANFERDKGSLGLGYQDIQWVDSLNIIESARAALGLHAYDKLPPLSFMAVPIMNGTAVYGVVRCSITKKGPYYFADHELELLGLIAAQVSYLWTNLQRQREIQEENRAWQSLVESIGSLNSFVHRELSREAPAEQRIFAEAIKITKSVIRNAEIMDFRLLDDSTRELYLAETQGEVWNEGTKEEIDARRRRRFPIDETHPRSAGAYVFQSGEVYVTHNIQKEDYYSETFPATKRLIVAPIRVEDRTYGVLDIRGTRDCDFPKHAPAIAELLGRQIGLYQYLAATIGELRNSRVALKENISYLEKIKEVQTQGFEDLVHQLRSPLISVFPRIQRALKEVPPDSKLESTLFAIRGLFRKIRSVVMNTGLFTELARTGEIRSRTSPLQADTLVRMFIVAAKDNQLMVDPSRSIRFHVHQKSFDKLQPHYIQVDHDLLEQSIMNILDNAGKYSFPNTEVSIYGGLTKTGRFNITVSNRGVPLHSEFVHLCLTRGWRGGLAELTTGEGSGIGLWIVDNIMKSHGGELIIIPTSNGITKVSLVFPILKR
jgi:signal transduction histidine kinase